MNIEGIDFDCTKGAIIIGGNSSGKSTILKKIKNDGKKIVWMLMD